jgi:molybdenum cofactor cytidylyltransferase
MSDSNLHAIVLAGGASTRFGSPKQLIRLHGRPLLHTIVARASEIAGQSVSVVLGANASELSPLLRHSPASLVINRGWQEGIASSIRAAVARLPPSCEGALLVLIDQPAVTAADLQRLVAAWRRQPDAMAAAQFSSTVGAPAIFPRALFPALLELRGDRGAQLLLQRHPDRVVRVPIEGAALDVDTPEDLLQLGT